MKFASLSISLFVAIISIILFRAQVFEFATTAFDALLGQITTTGDTTTTLESHKSPDLTNSAEDLTTANMSIPRAIRKVFLAVEQAEGAGARVRRSIGTPQLRNFSPFLMLDHFSIKPGAGFPDHPHRGQETSEYSTPPSLPSSYLPL